jgi:hypothetical protein
MEYNISIIKEWLKNELLREHLYVLTQSAHMPKISNALEGAFSIHDKAITLGSKHATLIIEPMPLMKGSGEGKA